MKCSEASQIIYTYLDGHLVQDMEKELILHINSCSACQGELAQAKQIHELITKVCCPVEPPANFVENVMTKIDKIDNVIEFPVQNSRSKWLDFIDRNNKNLMKYVSVAVLCLATGLGLLHNSSMLPKFIATSKPPVIKIPGIGGSAKGNPQVQPSNNIKNNIKEEVPSGNPMEIAKADPDTLGETGKNQQPADPQSDGQNTSKDAAKAGSNQIKKDTDGKDKSSTSSKDRTLNPDFIEDNPNNVRLDGPIEMASFAPKVSSTRVALETVVLEDGVTNAKPKWTNDKEFVYLSNKDSEKDKYSIWVKDTETGKERVLASNSVEKLTAEGPSTKSPDGTKTLEIEDKQLFINNLKANEKIAITPKLSSNEVVAAWSPDGSTVAINLGNSTKEKGLWLAKADGSTWYLGTSVGGGNAISWSPDGKKIAFTDNNNNIYILVPEKSSLFSVVPEGDNVGPTILNWSPNSEKLLFDWSKSKGKVRGIFLADIAD